jgi:hypothetical protein
VPAKSAQPAKWIKPSPANQSLSSHAPVSHSGGAHSVNSFFHPAQPTPQAGRSSNQTAAPVPPELSVTKIPRRVEFNKNCGRLRPELFQLAMIINPAIWIAVSMFFTAFTFDNDLRLHGINCTAIVTNVQNSQYRRPNIDVTVQYKVNGVTYTNIAYEGENTGKYKVGNRYTIRTLPEHPSFIGPLDSPPETRQVTDLSYSALFLLISLLCELGIWSTALKHRRLAKKGVPLLATVDTVKSFGYSGRGSSSQKYSAIVNYQYSTQSFTRSIHLSESEFYQLTSGTTEIILCNPANPKEIALYKFCRYHPIIASKPTP